jgi:hypothetical protein
LRSDAPITSANDLVLATLAAYPLDGSYAYWWPDDVDWGGNPHDIYYLGRMFSPGDPERRSYCVGMTFEVFMSVEEQLDEPIVVVTGVQQAQRQGAKRWA